MIEKIQYKHYLNVRKAFLNKEYRGLDSDDAELKYEEFTKILLMNKYLLLKCKYPQSYRIQNQRGKYVFVVITRFDSEFHNRSKELVNLLDKLSAVPEAKNNDSIDLILITKELLKKRTIKKTREYAKFNYSNILSVRFIEEMPKANLCNKHEIIPNEEVKKLADECYIQIDKQDYISEDDTQNIWIGGLSGEIIKITRPSLMAGVAISYRYVTGVIAQPNDNMAEADLEEEEDDDEKKDE